MQFFSRTYLTEGLRDLIERAVRRLSGDDNASPVVNLQTNFGGGKTHSMLALWHLAAGLPVGLVPAGGAGPARRSRVRRAAGERRPGRHRRQPHLAVRVGEGRTAPRSTRCGASWPGSSAAPEAFAIVAKADADRTPPGAALHTLLAPVRPGGHPHRRVGGLRAQPDRRARTWPAGRSTTSSPSRRR